MDRHDDVVFMIHYNGVFKYDPLRYEQFRVVEMHTCTTDRVMFTPLLDMLVAKLKNNIWALFLCILGLDVDSSGMKLIKNDENVHALYDLTEKHVTLDLFVAYLPHNLANYYHQNLCLDGSDEEVTSKKRNMDLERNMLKVSVKASGFGFGSFCKCKKTVKCAACLLRRWNRSRGREVQTEIALDVAKEEVVGQGKGRDGNEHVQWMLHVICVINVTEVKVGCSGMVLNVKENRGRGSDRDHQDYRGECWKILMGHGAGMSKGGSGCGFGCGGGRGCGRDRVGGSGGSGEVFDEVSFLFLFSTLNMLLRNDRGNVGGVGAAVSG
ncbi:hypothetical protein Tco_1195224 [Tanacetum coccineum]